MIISWRGNVIGIGKPTTRAADSLVIVAAAKEVLIHAGMSEDAANKWLKYGVDVALGMGEHDE